MLNVARLVETHQDSKEFIAYDRTLTALKLLKDDISKEIEKHELDYKEHRYRDGLQFAMNIIDEMIGEAE